MKIHNDQIIPNVIRKLSHLLGVKIKNRKLNIPKKLGSGYCAGYIFNENIRMVILNYELNKDLIVENPDINNKEKKILFKFQNVFPKKEFISEEKKIKLIPSVLIGTSKMNTDVVIPIDTSTSSINIEIEANYLNSLFNLPENSPVLKSLLQNAQPLLFEQIIYPSLQKIIDEIVMESFNKTFELFFLRIKAEELVCRLLIELEKRDEQHVYALKTQDIHAIYKVKEQLLKKLQVPPVIKELAAFANMSPTKLKRLFKQIFGNSIFNYYQEFRIREAARLLKSDNFSVSDVGYKMGFTNLSHFSRIFEKHMGMKPKQYSRD